MKNSDLPILYVKTGCPYCTDVIDFLNEHGIGFRQVNVTNDAVAFAEMQRKSGQTKAPTLDWHGQILADFGLDELLPFLHRHYIVLEDS